MAAESEPQMRYMPCTIDDLDQILRNGEVYMLEPQRVVDEVYDNVFVGEESVARNKCTLKDLGITHVLNCAQGADHNFCVDTNEDYYEDVKIKFCGLNVTDEEESDLKKHFNTAVAFIDDALSSPDGNVLIHCVMGYSRSATVAIAYLMIRRGMTVHEATRTVRAQREIGPNDGFLQQLCDLNRDLHKE